MRPHGGACGLVRPTRIPRADPPLSRLLSTPELLLRAPTPKLPPSRRRRGGRHHGIYRRRAGWRRGGRAPRRDRRARGEELGGTTRHCSRRSPGQAVGQEWYLFAARPELHIPGAAPMTYVDDPTPATTFRSVEDDDTGYNGAPKCLRPLCRYATRGAETRRRQPPLPRPPKLGPRLRRARRVGMPNLGLFIPMGSLREPRLVPVSAAPSRVQKGAIALSHPAVLSCVNRVSSRP